MLIQRSGNGNEEWQGCVVYITEQYTHREAVKVKTYSYDGQVKETGVINSSASN
jgi:hypothetical protein